MSMYSTTLKLENGEILNVPECEIRRLEKENIKGFEKLNPAHNWMQVFHRKRRATSQAMSGRYYRPNEPENDAREMERRRYLNRAIMADYPD